MLIQTLIKKIHRYMHYINENISYGSFGRRSKVIKPMRILGKRNIFIGERVHILNNARLEAISEYAGVRLSPKLIIGARTTIEQNCHIIATDELRIGEDCVFSAFVYISDCNHQYIPGVHINDTELVVKKTTIGNNVFIGIGARIMPGVTLGDGCVVGANAVVTHDVPERTVVAGVPAKVIKKL